MNKEEILFGKIAVNEGLAGRDAVERALETQKKIMSQTGSVARIGDILVQIGALTVDQRDHILDLQRNLLKKAQIAEGRGEEKEADECKIRVEPGLCVDISEDRMTAGITLSPKEAQNLTVDLIKESIEQAGIVVGVVEDDILAEYLELEEPGPEPLVVAKGVPFTPGRDDELILHFDADPFQLEALRDGEPVDFLDYSRLPMVDKGRIIAEVKRGHDGRPGRDVQDNEIPAPGHQVMELLCGPGTALTADGNQVVSELSGRPSLSPDNRFFVFPVLTLDQDIGPDHKPIQFDGLIEINGAVEGVSITGGSLLAREVVNAKIKVRGDVVVGRGIVGGTVIAGGNIRALYIQRVKMKTVGDVAVEQGIIDSDLESGGYCTVRAGKILSSNISVLKGLQAEEVGSDASTPTTIVLGIDHRVDRFIDKIKDQINELKQKKTAEKEKLDGHLPSHKKLKARISEIKDTIETAQNQKASLKQKLKEMKGAGNAALLAKVSETIKHLDEVISSAFEKMEPFEQPFKELESVVDELQKKIKILDDEMDQRRKQITQLTNKSLALRGTPEVKITHALYPDTTIRGPNSSKLIKETHPGAVVREMRVATNINPSGWEMHLTPLKKRREDD